jgi:PAS domain S-box-containing protein
MRTHPDRLQRYAFALLATALIGLVYIPVIGDRAGTPILVYFFAVLLSAWYGGLGPGLLTTALIALLTSHTTFPTWRVVRLALGIASGVSISALAEVLHAARRRAELNEQRFRALIEKGRDFIFILSADGLVRYPSPAVADTLGYSSVGRNALELIHPDDRDGVGRLLDELRSEDGASRDADYRVRGKEGTWRWLEGTVTNLLSDAAVGGLVCNSRDVTGRKCAEREIEQLNRDLRRRVNEFQTLLEVIPIGIGIAEDPECQTIRVNPCFARMLGISTRENASLSAPEGKRPTGFRVLHGGKEMEPDELPMQSAAARGVEVRDLEVDVVREDGQMVTLLEFAAPLRDEWGQIRGSVGAFLDVTQLKRAHEAQREAKEAAEAASRAKDRFLAVLSHELRTPLTPVLLAVSALLERDEVPGLRPTLEMIRRNVELEARLIDDLLDVARIGRGALRLDPRIVDAHEVVLQAVDVCRGEIAEGRITLGLDLSALDHYVEADPARFQQVIWNLLKNATRFTPPDGAITVRSRNRTDPEPDGRTRLVIEVVDTGVGIEAEALARIFEIFEQREVSPGPRSGLGLGLAIGRSLAEAQGGRLTAASPGPGQGSTFVLELPTVNGRAVVKPRLGSAEPCLPRSRGQSILLVEDNRDTLRYLAQILGARGHHVTTAERLSEAYHAAADQRFDLLISDIELPDGTGLELMRHPVIGRLPAVAMSGYGSEWDIRESLEAGFAEHLTKPVDLNRLIAAIHRVTAARAEAEVSVHTPSHNRISQ